MVGHRNRVSELCSAIRPSAMGSAADEYTRECLAIAVPRYRTATDVQEVLGELFLTPGCTTHIRSDNGPELIARSLRPCVARVEFAPLVIEPSSPWGRGYGESFNGKFRYDFLDGELFYTLLEEQVLIEPGNVTTHIGRIAYP